MTTNDEQCVPSDEEVQELIVGLLLDAGDYVRHGQPDPGETLTWNQREVRAWRAARLLSERHAHDARVRRDGAREALDGYADAEEDSFLALHVKGAPISAAQCSHAAMTAREYRDTHYPEGDDQ